ncbi:N-terminal nucleophile aminohydrolase [Ramicandelaber brevisporus]|nr:N-terminal nucleophile aminohydrolase [Ramicandelaber brevisporus]
MCRFLVYKSRNPILLADLITRPSHSIINQSFASRLRIDPRQTTNGDGFGLGFYDEISTDDVADSSGAVTVSATSSNEEAALSPISAATLSSSFVAEPVSPALTSMYGNRDTRRSRRSKVAARSAMIRGAAPGSPYSFDFGDSVAHNSDYYYGGDIGSSGSLVDSAYGGSYSLDSDLSDTDCDEQWRLPNAYSSASLGHRRRYSGAGCSGSTTNVRRSSTTVATTDIATGSNDSNADDIDRLTPCIFTSTLPAWSNLNLRRLAEKIRSRVVFAHVRAATGGTPTSESNCHPWRVGNLMWMHNGGITGFDKIRRRLHAHIRDDIFNVVEGNTDSEWAFALFLSLLNGDPFTRRSYDWTELRDALFQTIALINEWLEAAGVTEANGYSPSLLNIAVTSGSTVVCTRYVSSSTLEAASLYFSSGTHFGLSSVSASNVDGRSSSSSSTAAAKNSTYRMSKHNKREDVVVIASEPLTFVKDDWQTIPTNTMLVVTPDFNANKKTREDKAALMESLQDSVDQYPHIFVFEVANMRNTFLKDIRTDLKASSRFYFGKNKIMAKALAGSSLSEEEELRPELRHLAAKLNGDVGLLFTSMSKDEVVEYFDQISELDYARSNYVIGETVVIPSGQLFKSEDEPFPSNMEPQLRNLGMPTSLKVGKVVIENDYTICKEGDSLTPNQAQLLKLFCRPLAEFRVKLLCHWSDDKFEEL